MPPRHFTNPAPKTDSARESLKSFFCELCQKGYARMPEFEAHESSYDHQHRKRLKDMKQLTKVSAAAASGGSSSSSSKGKDRASGFKPLSFAPLTASSAGGTASGGGFKKSGFKSAFTSTVPPASITTATGSPGGGGGAFRKIGLSNATATTASSTNAPGREQDAMEGDTVTKTVAPTLTGMGSRVAAGQGEDEDFGDERDFGYEYYNPRRPTDCGLDCLGRH